MPYNVANEEEGSLLPGSVQFEEKAPERKSRSFLLTALLIVTCSVVGYAAGSAQVLHSTFTNFQGTYDMGTHTAANMYPTPYTGNTGTYNMGTHNAANMYPTPYTGNTGTYDMGTHNAANMYPTPDMGTTGTAVDAANAQVHEEHARAMTRVTELEAQVAQLKAQAESVAQSHAEHAKAMAEDAAHRAKEQAEQHAAEAARRAEEEEHRAAAEAARAKAMAEDAAHRAKEEAEQHAAEAARRAEEEEHRAAAEAAQEATNRAHAEDAQRFSEFKAEVEHGAHHVSNAIKGSIEQLKSATEITDKITEV